MLAGGAAVACGGKICWLHAYAPNLAAYVDLISATGVDLVEAIPPPPLGHPWLG